MSVIKEERFIFRVDLVVYQNRGMVANSGRNIVKVVNAGVRVEVV